MTDEIYQIMKAKKKINKQSIDFVKKKKNISKFCECEQIINLKKQTNSKHSVYL